MQLDFNTFIDLLYVQIYMCPFIYLSVYEPNFNVLSFLLPAAPPTAILATAIVLCIDLFILVCYCSQLFCCIFYIYYAVLITVTVKWHAFVISKNQGFNMVHILNRNFTYDTKFYTQNDGQPGVNITGVQHTLSTNKNVYPLNLNI